MKQHSPEVQQAEAQLKSLMRRMELRLERNQEDYKKAERLHAKIKAMKRA